MSRLSTIKSVIRRSPLLSAATIAVLVIGVGGTSWAMFGPNQSNQAADTATQETDQASPDVKKSEESKKREEKKPSEQTPQPKPQPKPAPPAPVRSASCANPVFQTSDTNGGWSTQGYYVHNNMWNDEYGFGPETLYACSHNNWYVTSSQVNHEGAVLTYPNVHKDYSGRTISSFTTLKSTFAATSPQVGIYNVAYDI